MRIPNLVGSLVKVVALGAVNGFFFTAGSLAAKRLSKELGLEKEDGSEEKDDVILEEDDEEIL